MKFSKYFMMAGAAFMLAACSSEEPIGQAPGSEVLDGAEVYASFRINMVSPDGTRASEAVDAVGDDNEYLIDNGKILIFGVPNEVMQNKTVEQLTLDERVKARFIVAADLENMDDATDGTGSIKDTYSSVSAKFAKGTFSSANYGAYLAVCILNCEDAVSGITSFLPTPGETFSDWGTRDDMNSHISFSKEDKTYFKMTNAPVYNGTTNGTTSADKHTVLEIIDPDLVFEYEAELDGAQPAAEFTVQRLAAKVTLNSKEADKVFDVDTEGYEGKVTLNAWAIDITRKTTFPVQNVWYDTESDAMNAFLTDATVDWIHSSSRCHWGYSKFYDKGYENTSAGLTDLGKDFNFKAANQITTWSDNPAYIRENMVAYNKMAKGNTTRVVVKATYTLDGETNAQTFVKVSNVAKLYTVAEFTDLVKTNYLTVVNAGVADEADKVQAGNVTVTLKTTGNAYTFGDAVTIKDGEKTYRYTVPTTATDDERTAIEAEIAIINKVAGLTGIYDVEDKEVYVYANGVCYYPVYIQHFAKEQEKAGINVDNINYLTDYTPAHTGRYAIVRNNWYDLTINSVSGPGYPTIPPTTPDEPVDGPTDTTNKFLNVDINVLKWAKRTQGVDL